MKEGGHTSKVSGWFQGDETQVRMADNVTKGPALLVYLCICVNTGDRMADNVTRDQHSQAFGVIAKALSRNTK